MTKEMIVSATDRETAVAILEDDLVSHFSLSGVDDVTTWDVPERSEEHTSELQSQ